MYAGETTKSVNNAPVFILVLLLRKNRREDAITTQDLISIETASVVDTRGSGPGKSNLYIHADNCGSGHGIGLQVEDLRILLFQFSSIRKPQSSPYSRGEVSSLTYSTK
jgi:hypothetical protein